MGDLANVVATQPSDDFTLECVGLLANLSLPELDYSTLLQRYGLVSWLKSQLVPGLAPDDLVLEVSSYASQTSQRKRVKCLKLEKIDISNLI